MEGACIQPVLLLSTPNSGTLAVSINVEVTASDNELKGSGECPKRWLACINRLESFVAMLVTNTICQVKIAPFWF